MQSDDCFIVFLFFLLTGLIHDEDAWSFFQIDDFQARQFAEWIFRGYFNVECALSKNHIVICIGECTTPVI